MNCKEALPKIHDYLDDMLDGSEASGLKKHLLACPDCSDRFRKLEHTEALVRSLPRGPVPVGITQRVMLSLPARKKRNAWSSWVKRHPAVSAASVFFLVMLGSFLSIWNQDQELMVKGSDLQDVVIEGKTVYIPPGRTVNGNLMVRGGDIKVDGVLNGNLVVIDGSLNMASTAKISGQIKQIDQAFEWFWYQVNDVLGKMAK
jgi:hypothetical protein